jgi:antitoxin (DNA-binding transcriptional repressor) of toxin-antitoxin stability system
LFLLLEIDKGASGGYFAGMRTVGLKILKNKLSEYVRLAAAGETVAITDRNRVVAEIGPPKQHATETVIERGIREGWIRPAVRGPDWPPKPKPVEGLTFEQLMADLDKDREDRW